MTRRRIERFWLSLDDVAKKRQDSRSPVEGSREVSSCPFVLMFKVLSQWQGPEGQLWRGGP